MNQTNTLTRRGFLGSSALTAMGLGLMSDTSMLKADVSGGGPLAQLPTIPYGAVYFRKSNPPREDWERDYRQASQDGMNCFRHWFMWSAIEAAPGQYDWEEYDRQLDLAAQNGICTIIGIFLDVAPQWAFQQFPHARIQVVKNSKVQQRLGLPVGARAHSHYTGACAVAGWPGLCFDNEDVLQRGELFLKALVKRYKDHSGMAGYDVWNELNQYGDFGACHCEASTEKFRHWLKEKYGDLKTLGKAWYRYSYVDWQDVESPRNVDPYPDSMDWALFRVDNAMRLFKRRVALIRKLDKKNPLTTHAIPLGTLKNIGPETYPLFQAGRLVDIHGFSGGCNHEEHTRLRWEHWCKIDLTRSASEGKPFWAAEMPGGASWFMRGVAIDKGRVASPSDIRLYSLTHFAGGVRGVFSPRWRPLQDGKHVGNFGFYAMDGAPTDRSAAAGDMARWANAQKNRELWQTRPVWGDIGLLVVPESQIHNYVKEDSSAYYYRSITGAYQGFLFNSIQADFVPADRINDRYDILYLPYPMMLPEAVAKQLKTWVAQGGTLISEGCPAYFGDRGRAGISQPNYGLNELFGVKQSFVQFTPDLLEKLRFTMKDGKRIAGGLALQSYEVTTGNAVGHFDDGRVAVMDHAFGKGRTRLIGTFPGYAYQKSYDRQLRQFFADCLAWAGREAHVTTSDERIIARIQTNGDRSLKFLWVINSARTDVPVKMTLAKSYQPVKRCLPVWGGGASLKEGAVIQARIPARDALVLKLV